MGWGATKNYPGFFGMNEFVRTLGPWMDVQPPASWRCMHFLFQTFSFELWHNGHHIVVDFDGLYWGLKLDDSNVG